MGFGFGLNSSRGEPFLVRIRVTLEGLGDGVWMNPLFPLLMEFESVTLGLRLLKLTGKFSGERHRSAQKSVIRSILVGAENQRCGSACLVPAVQGLGTEH